MLGLRKFIVLYPFAAVYGPFILTWEVYGYNNPSKADVDDTFELNEY